MAQLSIGGLLASAYANLLNSVRAVGGFRLPPTRKAGAPGSGLLRGYYGRYSNVLTEAGNRYSKAERRRERKAAAKRVKLVNKRTTQAQQSNARLRDRGVKMFMRRKSRYVARRYLA